MYEFNPMGGGASSATSCGSTRPIARSSPRTRFPACSSTGTPAIRRSGSSTSTPAVRPTTTASTRTRSGDSPGRSHRATSEFEPLPAVRQAEQGRRRPATRHPKRRGLRRSTRPASFRRPPGRRPSRTACSSRPAGATTSPSTPTSAPRVDGTHNADDLDPRTVLRRLSRTTAASPTWSIATTSRCSRDSSAIRSARWRRCGPRRRTYPGLAQPEVRLSRQHQPPEPGYFNSTPFIQYRFNNGIPNQLTQTACVPRHGEVPAQHPDDVVLRAGYIHASRLTLQGGIRYDGIGTGYPDTGAGGPDYQLMPTPFLLRRGTTDEIHWKDITPRIGAAYDLFGNGKTAVKFNIGKYLTALTASNSDLDLQPAHPHHPPDDADVERHDDVPGRRPRRGNFIPDCDLVNVNANGECGAWTTRTSARRSSRSPSTRS